MPRARRTKRKSPTANVNLTERTMLSAFELWRAIQQNSPLQIQTRICIRQIDVLRFAFGKWRNIASSLHHDTIPRSASPSSPALDTHRYVTPFVLGDNRLLTILTHRHGTHSLHHLTTYNGNSLTESWASMDSGQYVYLICRCMILLLINCFTVRSLI
jgi:hypothetical protein